MNGVDPRAIALFYTLFLFRCPQTFQHGPAMSKKYPEKQSFTAPHPSPTHHLHHQLTTAAEILSREKVISDMPEVVCLAASASHLSGFARPASFFHFYLFTTFLAKRNQTSSPGTEPMKIVTWLPARGWVLQGGKQFRQLILHPMCPVRRVATSSLVFAPNAHPIAWSQMRDLVKANHISDETEDRRYGREKNNVAVYSTVVFISSKGI